MADSQVLVNPDPAPRAAAWRQDKLTGTLTGVWGLDDELVLSWCVHGSANVMRHANWWSVKTNSSWRLDGGGV